MRANERRNEEDMKKYVSFFRMRFSTGLQYRQAALAGMSTQFVWGAMEILLFKAFYEADPSAFPMEFSALISYIWLQQAFLSLYMMWFLEREIFDSITSGGIAYELCRPLDLYSMWFARNIANRMSKAVLRCIPILLLAALLPKPYGMQLPRSFAAFLLFLCSMGLALLVTVAFSMILYLLCFYTISPLGIRMVAFSFVEFFSGSVIPLPFLPDGVRQVCEFLPFASMQNVPFRIYSGNLSGSEGYEAISLQLFWVIILISFGKYLLKKALNKVVVQGG